MISKSYSKNQTSCRVTFKVPEGLEAESVTLLGDFNGWQPEVNPLKSRKDGSWSTTVSVKAGQEYRFRYLVDGNSWLNDEEADSLVPNRFGGEDGLLEI
jgi:1,4-alpha-glucan branching enzyme